MKKITLLSTFYNKQGGISTFVKNVEKVLSEEDSLSISVVSPDKGDDWPSNKIFIAIKVFFILWKIKPDEIHCHCAWYLQLGALLFALTNKHVGVFCFKHSDIDIKSRSFLARKTQVFLDSKASKIVFISEYLKVKWETQISKIYSNASFIKGGVNLYDKANRKDNERNSKSITYVGVFEYPGKVKGIELLIESFEKYVQISSDVNTKLKIIGGGTLTSRVLDKINKTSISSQIEIINGVTDPKDYYLNSDLHCHITYQDAMPLVIMEALSAGTPVLASKVCGIPEIEACGLILVDNQSFEIAKKINELLISPPLVRLSINHSWTAVTKKILEVTKASG